MLNNLKGRRGLARRESGTPIPERLREAAREDDSGEEYEPEEEEQYDSDLDADKDDWVCAIIPHAPPPHCEPRNGAAHG